MKVILFAKLARKHPLILFAAFAFFCASAGGATIYVTADNLNGSNLFGTLDLASGHFTQITNTNPLFLALTTGPGGQLFGADANSGNLYTISPAGVSATFGSVTTSSSSYGLAYSGAAGKFFADTLNPATVDLYSVSGDGNSSSFIAQLAGPNSGFFPTGNLTYGPGGNLYFNYSPDPNGNGANSQLYTVNSTTGALSMVGSGLGSDILALFYDGNTLYGLDANVTSNIGVFTIDPATGVATQIATVTGLPASNDYFVDAATAVVPEPSSMVLLVSSFVVWLFIRQRHAHGR